MLFGLLLNLEKRNLLFVFGIKYKLFKMTYKVLRVMPTLFFGLIFHQPSPMRYVLQPLRIIISLKSKLLPFIPLCPFSCCSSSLKYWYLLPSSPIKIRLLFRAKLKVTSWVIPQNDGAVQLQCFHNILFAHHTTSHIVLLLFTPMIFLQLWDLF